VADLAAELEGLLRRAGGDLWTSPPFDTVAPDLRRVADIAFAGDGEPTTPPQFPAAARAAREARDHLAPGVPLRLLTNATLFHKDRVRAALAEFDELWCKLDAGTEAYFHVVDGTRLPFRRILDNLLSRRP
jgi:wyosine [tRNA(Phe)-imidazoG37] synthetase (radical SAM superfamily)